MTARSTSAISHDMNSHDTLKHRVRVWVRLNGPCTRKQIATAMCIETSTISGIVKPLVDKNFLDETGHMICPITGRRSIRIESPVQQLKLI